jgi:hypothetical protein
MQAIFTLALGLGISQAQTPANPSALDFVKRGDTLHERGATDQAIAEYDKAIKVDPRMRPSLERRIQQISRSLLRSRRPNPFIVLIIEVPNYLAGGARDWTLLGIAA